MALGRRGPFLIGAEAHGLPVIENAIQDILAAAQVQMQTVTELLGERAEALLRGTRDLVDRSTIERWNNHPGSALITVRPYKWSKLDEGGLQLQSKLLEDAKRFFTLVNVLTKETS